MLCSGGSSILMRDACWYEDYMHHTCHHHLRGGKCKRHGCRLWVSCAVMTAKMTKPKKRVQGELKWEDGNDTG